MFRFQLLERELQEQIPAYNYQFYRIVDIQNHAVYDYQKKAFLPTNKKCYETWGRSAPCANCTSCRAVQEQKHIIKLEYCDNQVFLINSYPVRLLGKWYSLELLEDVSDSFTMNTETFTNHQEVRTILMSVNELIIKDAFTHLYNKQFLIDKLPYFMEQARKQHRPLSISIMDIDHFKQVNDTYGHMFGDKVILKIAEVLRSHMNDTLYAIRLGGDEFLLIFVNGTQAAAQVQCEAMMTEIHDCTFQEHSAYHISMSCGVCQWEEEETYDALLDRADYSMYHHKHDKAGYDMVSSLKFE